MLPGSKLSDTGGVTAEFAIVLPIVLLVLGIAVGSIWLSAHRMALVSGAFDLARLQARGDTELAVARKAELPAGTAVNGEARGQLWCVTLTAAPGSGLLAKITLSATGCAAMSGATPEATR